MAYLSVVIPVYNEEHCLGELYRRLTESLAAIARDYEIVLVDDGSRDRSWEMITGLAQKDDRVKALQFSRNFGQHYCITAGLDACDGDWVVIMDADLQDRPEEIAKLHARAQEGYDIVHARRVHRRHPLPEKVAAKLFYWFFNYMTGMHHDGQVGTFRMLSRRVVENFRMMREQMRYLGGMLEWMGFPTSKVDVQHDARKAGSSAYSFRRRWRLAQGAIIAYSDRPLQLTVQLGFLIALLALLYGVYVLARVLFFGAGVEGWPSLIVSIFFLGGIVIATLGIVGIYLERTFAETKRRPLYIIKERVNLNKDNNPRRHGEHRAQNES